MSLWLTDLKNLHKRIVEIGKIDDSRERKIILALQEKVHIWLHAGTRRKHFFRIWAFVYAAMTQNPGKSIKNKSGMWEGG